MANKPAKSDTDSVDALSSGDLAALIIDALLRARLLKQEDVERSVKIATEEIDARKNLGDY